MSLVRLLETVPEQREERVEDVVMADCADPESLTGVEEELRFRAGGVHYFLRCFFYDMDEELLELDSGSFYWALAGGQWSEEQAAALRDAAVCYAVLRVDPAKREATLLEYATLPTDSLPEERLLQVGPTRFEIKGCRKHTWNPREGPDDLIEDGKLGPYADFESLEAALSAGTISGRVAFVEQDPRELLADVLGKIPAALKTLYPQKR